MKFTVKYFNYHSITCSLLILLVTGFLFSCKRPVQYPEGRNNKSTRDASESLLNINKYLVKRQQEIIEAYVERVGWDMKTSHTGLWYMICENGTGARGEKDKIIALDYTISLLDGTLCDASPEGKPKSFRIGHGGVEPGLEEGALLLREGDKARFIMAPHLAHGNFGDSDKIPPGEILIYDVFVRYVQ